MSSVRGPCCRERFYFGLATFQVFLFPPNKKGNKTNIENCVGFFKRKPVGSRKLTKNSLFFSQIHDYRTPHAEIISAHCLTFFNLDPHHHHHRHRHRYFSL